MLRRIGWTTRTKGGVVQIVLMVPKSARPPLAREGIANFCFARPPMPRACRPVSRAGAQVMQPVVS
jgi:hypothetical protein